MTDPSFWKRCSICKKGMPFESRYYVCSVSTCRHPRTGYRFCSPGCWDAHLGFANHRSEVWAEEAQSPKQETAVSAAPSAGPRGPIRRVVEAEPDAARTAAAPGFNPQGELETLVVVSKVKGLISKEASCNTSQCCIDALTNKVAKLCRAGIERARAAGRKTVMGRDIK